jgi:hypothetical protein
VVSNAIAYSGQVPLPPISAKRGWVMEQMSGSENNARRVSTWDDDMTKRERQTTDHWRTALCHVITAEARHHGFQAAGLGPNPTPGETQLNSDAGGWVRLKDAKVFIDGRGWLGKYNAERLEAEARGRKFRSGLVLYNERGRNIATDDMMQVVVHSDKDRYRCACQVNPYAAIEIPSRFACKHWRSLRMVNPLRTSTMIMDNGDINVIPFVGEPTRARNQRQGNGGDPRPRPPQRRRRRVGQNSCCVRSAWT